jgi:hypothetical protein
MRRVPDEELWRRIVDEAMKRKVSVYDVLKDAFECYVKEKEGSNVSLEAIEKELQDLKRRVEELEKKVR